MSKYQNAVIDVVLEAEADAALDRYRNRFCQCYPALHIAWLRAEAFRRNALLGWFRGAAS